MNLHEIDKVKPADHGFVASAASACEKLGDEAVLLLVGSRAAGLRPMDDLDLWIIGNKRLLSPTQQEEYTQTGEVFVDRGDLTAHWKFHDRADLAARLAQWPAELMWILSTSKFMGGCRATHDDLVTRFATFPRDVAESKLKWLIGSYSVAPMLKAAAAGSITEAFAIAGLAVTMLAKLCCAAQCRPWPYSKWLTRVAGETTAGRVLMPFADRCVAAFMQCPRPSPGQHSIDWPPTRELKLAMQEVPQILSDLGWQGDWVSDPWKAVHEYFKRPAP